MIYSSGGQYGSGLPYYVKKEDARDIVKQQVRMSGFVMLALGIVSLVLDKVVVPKMNEIFPVNDVLLNWIPLALFGWGIVLLKMDPGFERVDLITKKYAKGEMIRTQTIIDWKYSIGTMLIVFAVVAYWVITLVLPIYNLLG